MKAMATARFEGGRGNVELIHARKMMDAAADCAIKNLVKPCFEPSIKGWELISPTAKYIAQQCSW
jgi:hypothetical protein